MKPCGTLMVPEDGELTLGEGLLLRHKDATLGWCLLVDLPVLWGLFHVRLFIVISYLKTLDPVLEFHLCFTLDCYQWIKGFLLLWTKVLNFVSKLKWQCLTFNIDSQVSIFGLTDLQFGKYWLKGFNKTSVCVLLKWQWCFRRQSGINGSKVAGFVSLIWMDFIFNKSKHQAKEGNRSAHVIWSGTNTLLAVNLAEGKVKSELCLCVELLSVHWGASLFRFFLLSMPVVMFHSNLLLFAFAKMKFLVLSFRAVAWKGLWKMTFTCKCEQIG
jgi:hypothetical protein